jgi:hypothetical protein
MQEKTLFRWPQRDALVACTAAGLVALVIYWRTCHRTITWWDCAQYSLAADTLGVVGPPGSLLLTILGWIATRLPLGITSAFTLNLVAGLLAACTIVMVVRAALGLYSCVTSDGPSPASWLVPAAIALGALPLAFGPTLWTYAAKFTPYVLTAAITAMILYALVQWWRTASDGISVRWLFIIALLIGVDFSVHRTNALLVPGIVLWVVIRQPRAIASIGTWAAGIAGLLTGLSLHLLLMPMAARAPALNMSIPSNWSRFWGYVTLEQMGGGFLFNVLPRRAGFFAHQVRDVMDALGSSFAAIDGMLFFLGAIPLALGVYGIIFIWQKDARLAAALVVLFMITVLSTVFYFNIPEDYFRPLHRHYLPCLVIFAVFSTYGAGAVMAQLYAIDGRRGAVLTGGALAVLAAVGIGRIIDNYATHDRSRSYFAYDFAGNLLRHLPPNAILLTNGDNDTFPLWYLQIVEGIRNDVNVVNIPLTNASWYVETVLGGHGGVAFSKPAEEMATIVPLRWEEQEITLPAPRRREPTDSIRLHVGPTAGEYLLVQDQVILDMIRTNRWKRPVLIATTVSSASLPWLRSYLRLEGLAYQFDPVKDPAPAIATLKSNLTEHYRYRGYADPEVHIDKTSGMMSQNYLAAFLMLASAVKEDQGEGSCEAVIAAMYAALPFGRLQPPEQIVNFASVACEP